MTIDPSKMNQFGAQKATVHNPQNQDLFDDKATSLKKRKAELEKQNPRRLTAAEREELKEISRQLEKINQEQRYKDFYSKKIF